METKTEMAAANAGKSSAGVYPLAYDYIAYDGRGESWGAVVAFGLWLRVGIGAAGLFVIGVSQLLAGEHTPGLALSLAGGGVVVMLAAWHYARLALRRMDDSEPAIAVEAAPDVDRTADRDVSVRPGVARGYSGTYAIE